ncbi:hypothetical protein VUR80DRAFT_5334 [Thermomyces stellatus]
MSPCCRWRVGCLWRAGVGGCSRGVHISTAPMIGVGQDLETDTLTTADADITQQDNKTHQTPLYSGQRNQEGLSPGRNIAVSDALSSGPHSTRTRRRAFHRGTSATQRWRQTRVMWRQDRSEHSSSAASACRIWGKKGRS